MRSERSRTIQAVTVLLAFCVLAMPQGSVRAQPDPTETTLAPAPLPAPPQAVSSRIEGRWVIGAGADAIRFTIAGQQLTGTTQCGPFSARLVQRGNRTQIVIASMQSTCPRPSRQANIRMRSQLERTATLMVQGGELVARDAQGAVLFTAQSETSATAQRTTVGLDGSWTPVQTLPVGDRMSRAPVFQITGSALLIRGSCNDYSGTISAPQLSQSPTPARILISSATTRLCALPQREQADAALLGTLDTVRFALLSQGRLELQTAPGRTTITLTRL